MPDGGQITIKSSIFVYDQNSRDDLTLEFGRLARITITDEGEGISEAHIARIFELFFSTKPIQKTPIMLCSGYTKRDLNDLQKVGMALLQKPYSRSQLHEILEQTISSRPKQRPRW